MNNMYMYIDFMLVDICRLCFLRFKREKMLMLGYLGDKNVFIII